MTGRLGLILALCLASCETDAGDSGGDAAGTTTAAGTTGATSGVDSTVGGGGSSSGAPPGDPGACRPACETAQDCCTDPPGNCPDAWPQRFACQDGGCVNLGCVPDDCVDPLQCLTPSPNGIPTCQTPCDDATPCEVGDCVGTSVEGPAFCTMISNPQPPCDSDADCGTQTCLPDGTCACFDDDQCLGIGVCVPL